MFRRSLAILAVTAFALWAAPSAAAGGGCVWDSEERTEVGSSASEVIADIAGCRYEPTTLYIEPGATVTWVNKDVVPHSVTGSFMSINSDELLERGDRVSSTFDEEGVYAYYCVLHPGMAASVVVGNPVDGVPKDGALSTQGRGTQSPPTSSGDATAIVAGVAAVAVVALSGGALIARKRRREIPAPGLLP